MGKKVLLLVNLGTPDSPSTSDVRKYLTQFLNDPRVIDIPAVVRFILVNLIIVPFRAPKSAKIYQKLWTKEGSPLLIHGTALREKVQEKLGDEYVVEFAMRYQHPSMESVLERIRKSNPMEITMLPLYPHYASSSTGSTIEHFMSIVRKWYVIPKIKIISQFYNHTGFIDTIVKKASEYNLTEYDHVLFSYHGLPVRQVDKVYDNGLCEDHDCKHGVTDDNQFCYKATCYETTRLIASKLSLNESNYTVAFQSRLDKNWLEPFSDKVVEQLAKNGAKKLLVFSPAFVADCLETTIEIGDEYHEIFLEHGGEKLDLVESLNSDPLWVDAVCDIAKNA